MANMITTSPRFLLTHHKTIKIGKYNPSTVVRGEDVDGDLIVSEIEANVQPLKFTTLMLMPESDRVKEWIKIFSVSELRQAEEGKNKHEGDIVQWNNKYYLIKEARQYQMGVLNHYEAHATKITTSAGYSTSELDTIFNA